MATLLSIVFLTLVLSTHHAVGKRGRISYAGNMRNPQEMLCSNMKGGVEKYCPKKESSPVPKLPLPCPSHNWNCEGDIIQTLDNVASWEDCGRACDNHHVDGCEYWTYGNPGSVPFCSLQSSCPGRRSDDSTSGAWNCPQSTVQTESTSICPSCGSCPCCIGACIWGVCLPLIGGCIPMAKTGASVEEACLYQANSLITNECSGNCSVDGDPGCHACISDNGAETCATTKSFGCFSCAYDVGQALYYCLKQGGSPEQILTCIIERIVDGCASCACELACKLYHPLCKLC